MRCPGCRHENPAGSNFCLGCGARLALAVRRDPVEHADGHYRDALALAEELGMRPLVAHCHLGLAKLSRWQRAGPELAELS